MSDFNFYPTISIDCGPLNPKLTLKALRELPLTDLFGLSDGSDDKTGHTTWRGALVFLAFLHSEEHGEHIGALLKGNRVVELGCGCGIAGLAMLRIVPDIASLHLTDGDGSAVDLARENYGLNQFSPSSTVVTTFSSLAWSADRKELPPCLAGSADVVVACDVVYDVSILPLLFETAAHVVTADGKGIFILSHICRSCFGSRAVGTEEELEEHITEIAAGRGFVQFQPPVRQRSEDVLEHDGQRGSLLFFQKTKEQRKVEKL
jgi:ribosomal protein L11 methylase PrmA